jgi:hypothetical protein
MAEELEDAYVLREAQEGYNLVGKISTLRPENTYCWNDKV